MFQIFAFPYVLYQEFLMNTTKKLQQVKLDQWAVLCKEQSESGLTVRQWCKQNGYTIHTYNYWKHRLKESYVDSVLPDIVPIAHRFLLHYTNCAIRPNRVLTTRSLSHFMASASLLILPPLLYHHGSAPCLSMRILPLSPLSM